MTARGYSCNHAEWVVAKKWAAYYRKRIEYVTANSVMIQCNGYLRMKKCVNEYN